MNNYGTVTGRKSSLKTRILAFVGVFCLVFTTTVMLDGNEVQAASKSSVRQVAFSPKGVDLTLANGEKKVKLTMTLSKQVKGANYAIVTLKNGKKARTVEGKIKASGKKITMTLQAVPYGWRMLDQRVAKGNWKVTKVVLKKSTTKKTWRNGYYSGGKYYSGYWYDRLIVPKQNLASMNVKKNTVLKLTEGSIPSIRLTRSVAKVNATGSVTFTATLKAGSKALSNKPVVFNFYGSTSGIVYGDKAAYKITVNTNASGVATYTVPSSILQREVFMSNKSIACVASYAGQSKKYKRANTAAVYTEITKEQIKMSYDTSLLIPANEGIYGYGAKKISVKVMNGTKPVANTAIKIDFKSDSSGYSAPASQTLTTDANGIATCNVIFNTPSRSNVFVYIKADFVNKSDVYKYESQEYGWGNEGTVMFYRVRII